MMGSFQFDILVIGSGAAGLRAAIAAGQSGRKVCVISKGPIGLGTSTSLSYGILAGVREEGSLGKHREMTLRAGRGINEPELVDVLVDEGPVRLQEILSWGVQAVSHQGSLFVKGRPLVWGEGIVRCLLEKARSLGVQFLGGLTVCKVFVVDGWLGVLAYSGKEDKWVVFTSRSLVLATGGGAALYLRHDNPGQILGEGYILALDAGATLQDMEFVQFHPAGLAEPSLPRILLPSSLMDKGRIVNGRGHEILHKYQLQAGTASKQARDFLSQAICHEIQKEGGEVWLDLRSIPEEGWAEDPTSDSIREILWERYGAKTRPFRVAPITHFIMGGVKIDAYGATAVPGFYAAGEVTGGLHGANRMRGNALTETLVFGARAGEAAAKWVEGVRAGSEKDIFEGLEAFLSGFRKKTTGVSPTNLKRNLSEILWNRVGVIRNQQDLKKAQEEVEGIFEESNQTSVGNNPGGIKRTLMLQYAARTALLIIRAALMREESRGAHFREDFPFQDDDRWLGHLWVSLGREGEKWSFEPISKKNSVKF